jgi:cytochrome b6-f complex iron-sulfur subunit
MEREPSSPHRRRFFLTTLLGGLGTVLLVAAGWPVWQFLSPRKGTEEEDKVAIPRSRIEVGGAHFFQFRGHPAVLVQNAPGDFIALSAVCTHLGCIVQWLPEKQEFLCPCHAGIFSREGKVVAGPPPKPLPSFPVALADDQVLVG